MTATTTTKTATTKTATTGATADRGVLGLCGFGTHPWPSVERTRGFFRRALEPHWRLRSLADDALPAAGLDAALHFAGSGCWGLEPHPDHPLVFALHGGVMLDRRFLHRHLGALETTDVLLVNCSADAAVLEGMFAPGHAPAVVHLPLPVAAGAFHPRDRAAARALLPLEEPDLLIGFVGRLLPQKGLHWFLRILALLRRRLAPRRLEAVVVGNYWLDYPVLPWVTEGYQAWIGRRIAELDLAEALAYLPARLTDDDLAACYAAVDVLIHPTGSLDENFGYAPIEAMACATPVVGTAYGGLRDTVVSGTTGALVPTWATRSGLRADLPAAVEAARSLLLDPAERERQGTAAAERAATTYSSAACGRILADAVERAVERRRAGAARPVRVLPEPPEPEPAGFLPPARPPWEHYWPAVELYASQGPPTVEPDDRLLPFAPLERVDGGVRLDDPAWPATFPLDDARRRLVEACEAGARVGDLLAAASDPAATARHLRELVADGLLLVTAAREEGLAWAAPSS